METRNGSAAHRRTIAWKHATATPVGMVPSAAGDRFISMSVIAASSAVSAIPAAAASRPDAGGRAKEPSTAGQLSTAEQRVVARMQQRDREVRAHEMTHISAGAGLVRGGATYSFERGPDGKLYAVGGEVSIDTSPGNTPQETIERARRIRSAALAPADPSPQDRQVAAAASLMESQARIELAASEREEGTGTATPLGQVRDQANQGRRLPIAGEPGRIGELIDTFA